MAHLAISRELLSGFARLDKRVQKKVNEIAGTFASHTAQDLRNLPGLHLETHANQADRRARTIRITDNHRGIVCDLGHDETFVLHAVLTHDEADRWIARNVFKANVATGALEILDLDAIEQEAKAAEQLTAPGPSLFDHRKDKEFTQLGISPELLPALRALSSEDQLVGLLSVLPPTQAETLIMLTGNEPAETVYAEVAGAVEPGAVHEDDLVAALSRPASESLFRVVTDEAELQDMLARPLAQWRIFLHHSQRDLAERPVLSGPARVTGGAGTGKTVVAVHRARYLASQLEDQTGKPILFTTFTRNLAESIKRSLRELGGADLLDLLDVVNVDTLANRLVRDHERSQPGIIADQELAQLWQEVADEIGVRFPGDFLGNEWEQVILAQSCQSRADYFQASRSGRGIPLDRRSRAEVWRAVETFNQRLVESGRRTFLQMADAAAGYISSRTERPYRHVIVDEAQDLHEAQWRMLRALVPEGPNDMFIVGDSHQRIYDRRTSLSKVGINIRGRSRRLRINYRTTFEILRWALALLGEETYDDLDGGVEEQDLAGYHSFLHGSDPTVQGFPSRKAQYDALVDQVGTWVDAGVHEEDIAIAARTGRGVDAVTKALHKGGIACSELKTSEPTDGGVRVGTMHRLKGVEFRCVGVVDADDDTIPHRYALTDRSADEVQHALDLIRERCLLYVACTRARDDLWVGWSGKPSRFLGPVLRDD